MPLYFTSHGLKIFFTFPKAGIIIIINTVQSLTRSPKFFIVIDDKYELALNLNLKFFSLSSVQLM